MSKRTYWYGFKLNRVESVPMLVALFIKYRHKNDRIQCSQDKANLISSRTENDTQMLILDLDYPHHYVRSTQDGHAHLYLDKEISTWRWVIGMIGLWISGVIEFGYLAWSLRRGANFVRPEGVHKSKEVLKAHKKWSN